MISLYLDFVVSDDNTTQLIFLTDHVYWLKGPAYNQLVILLEDYIVMTDAPFAQGQYNIPLVQRTWPNRKIKYVAITHAHFDHSGGARLFADTNATIVCGAPLSGWWQTVLSNPNHTVDQDAIYRRRTSFTPSILEVNNTHVLDDHNGTRVTFKRVANEVHANGYLTTYIESPNTDPIAFIADVWNPPAPTAALVVVNFLQAMRELNAPYSTRIFGAHFGNGTLGELIVISTSNMTTGSSASSGSSTGQTGASSTAASSAAATGGTTAATGQVTGTGGQVSTVAITTGTSDGSDSLIPVWALTLASVLLLVRQ
jgi:glyoxylase-like metal-dependent hydrolase (beta-lactamase superfamily II)